MRRRRRRLLLFIVTAVMAAAVLTPIFFALKLLLDAGLGVAFVTVIAVALLVGYVLRQETTS
jgi:putative flippase GtrA